MSLKREVRDLLDRCADEGCTYELGAGGHWKIRTPTGAIVGLPGTPSEYRGIANSIAELRRAGLTLRDESEIRKSTRPKTRARAATNRSHSVKELAHLRAELPAGRVKGSLPDPEPEPASDERARKIRLLLGDKPIKRQVTNPMQLQWTLRDAINMVHQGYSPEHAARMTGYELDLIRDITDGE